MSKRTRDLFATRHHSPRTYAGLSAIDTDLYAEGRVEPWVAGAVTDPRALSRREYDVLRWLALGKSGYEVAKILGISVCTVRAHIRNIMRKLEARNIPHAVALAFCMGILTATAGAVLPPAPCKDVSGREAG